MGRRGRNVPVIPVYVPPSPPCEVCGWSSGYVYNRLNLSPTHEEQHALVTGFEAITREGWVLLVDEGRTRMVVRSKPTKPEDAYAGLAATEQATYAGVETRNFGPWLFARREVIEAEVKPFRNLRPGIAYPNPVESTPKSIRLLTSALFGAQQVIELGLWRVMTVATGNSTLSTTPWDNERSFSGVRRDWFGKMILRELITT